METPSLSDAVAAAGVVVVSVDSTILQSPFAQSKASKSLRITCYGSSSSTTPDAYLKEARHAGYLLAKRGHVCVNGAGSFGCMAAMNDGADYGGGHIVGVIHEMWLTSGEDAALSKGQSVELRDGGAHSVFQSSNVSSGSSTLKNQDGAPTTTALREMLVAGGSDLQERKRLLVKDADGLLVLPGGPGTWDELWEMACTRNLGLTKLPIVCVNVNGYYESFRDMLQRAHDDQLVKLEPDAIVHFEDTALDAIQWLEEVHLAEGGGDPSAASKAAAKRRLTVATQRSILRKSSFMSVPATADWVKALSRTLSRSLVRATSWMRDNNKEEEATTPTKKRSIPYYTDVVPAFSGFKVFTKPLLLYSLGVATGLVVSSWSNVSSMKGRKMHN